MKWYLVLFLLLLDIVLVVTTKESPKLKMVKEKYQTLVDYIDQNSDKVPEKFLVLKKKILLSGTSRDIGYNVSKGNEIGLCLDGDVNDIFHVLLHELSHSTVKEYSHSEDFWKNFSELRELCSSIGLYQKIPERKPFCGKYIQD